MVIMCARSQLLCEVDHSIVALIFAFAIVSFNYHDRFALENVYSGCLLIVSITTSQRVSFEQSDNVKITLELSDLPTCSTMS